MKRKVSQACCIRLDFLFGISPWSERWVNTGRRSDTSSPFPSGTKFLPRGEAPTVQRNWNKVTLWGEAPDGSMQMFTWAVGRSASWVVKEIVMASTIMPPLPRYWPPALQRILAPMDLNWATNCFFLPSTDCNHQFCTILWRSKLGWDDSQRKDFVRRRRREPCTWFCFHQDVKFGLGLGKGSILLLDPRQWGWWGR